ncbi:MAG: prolipoprotein diacylglyceryl transferase [Polyangiales bacterium]|nr:prolipoprotein diacylglyceryl transferase [Myxococcales bacterium]
MPTVLFIPWFRLPTWHVPIPGLDWQLPIQPFGILVATGVLLATNVAERFGAKNGLRPAIVSDMVAHVVITAFVSCYFLNGALYEPDALMEIIRDPKKLFTTYLGLSSYGGFAGAILGLVIWKMRRGLSAIRVGDAAAFAFPLGWLFGRTGCFVVHDHPGRVTDFFLAVDNYEVGLPPYQPRHDLGLYEVFWCLVIVPWFFWLARKPRTPGLYIALLPITYAPIRFFLDYLRAEPVEGGDVRYFGFTPGQYASVLFLVAGVVMWWWIHRHPAPEVPADARVGAEETLDAEADGKAPGKGRRKRTKAKKA